MRRSVAATAVIIVAIAVACAKPSQFDRLIADEQWNDAAKEFSADSALYTKEDALYRAGTLFGTPGRPTYDPERARQLFATLLSRFPNTTHRDDARARMLLLDEVLRMRQQAMQREHDLETQIAALTKQTRDLRTRADSVSTASDSLRSAVVRIDADRRDKESQLQALRRELQRLKEIDLKPRPPGKA
ncbi:MAG TPA: hypothetical protein VGM50_19505 [Gemmatimonadaceae bacterium]